MAKSKSKRELSCVHFWEIEPATGPKSMGVCNKCGGTKEFLNHIEQRVWVNLSHTPKSAL